MATRFDRVATAVTLDVSRALARRITDYLQAPYIRGIEATQTIQYFRSSEHLTAPSAQGADNAIVLAAYKPAWVRVYVRSGGVTAVPGLTGRLTIERRYDGLFWSTVRTLAPQAPGTVTAPAV